MIRALPKRLTYSNVIASIALFVALGGGAYAVTKDSVKSKHIADGQVRSADLRDDGVKGNDVKENTLTGADIDEATLYGFDGMPGEDDFPVGGMLTGHIDSIGGGGDVRFGALSGRSLGDPDYADVVTGTPFASWAEVSDLRVAVPSALTAGQSRSFQVVRSTTVDGTIIGTDLQCTIEPGSSVCTDTGAVPVNSIFLALRITNVGASLGAADDAYVGVGVKVRANE